MSITPINKRILMMIKDISYSIINKENAGMMRINCPPELGIQFVLAFQFQLSEQFWKVMRPFDFGCVVVENKPSFQSQFHGESQQHGLDSYMSTHVPFFIVQHILKIKGFDTLEDSIRWIGNFDCGW